jgi:hypothetical protein
MRIVTDRPVVVVLALLGAGAMSVALGDPPAASDTPPSAAAPATSATSTAAVTPPSDANASAAASVKTSSAAQAVADNDALEKRLTNSGYKSKMRNGQKVWCKKQDELGSRLGAQEVCATPDEWRRSFRDNQDVVQQIQKIDSHASGK